MITPPTTATRPPRNRAGPEIHTENAVNVGHVGLPDRGGRDMY
jgi:hypothetical protein